MILHAQPILEAEAKLDELFSPRISEDSIFNMAMLVYEDEAIAKKLVKVYAESIGS